MINNIENTSEILRLSTMECRGFCKVCGEDIRPTEDFEMAVNHYLKKHGFILLHIGQETSHGDKEYWHSTVAVLGKPKT